MQIALSQILSTTDPSENLAQVETQVRLAAEQGARLVIFPEATMCRFGVPLDTVAQPTDGPWAEAVKRIARENSLTIVVGMFTPAERGRVRNTLLVTGPGVDASYDKIHLYDAFGFSESDTVTAGTEPVTVNIDGTTVGLATCYDVRFPALFQELASRGADLIVLSASWAPGLGKREQWELLVRARALDSSTFVAACDQAALASTEGIADATPTGVGASLIVDPFGSPVASLGPEPGLLFADMNLEETQAARNATGVLHNRRDFPSATAQG